MTQTQNAAVHHKRHQAAQKTTPYVVLEDFQTAVALERRVGLLFTGSGLITLAFPVVKVRHQHDELPSLCFTQSHWHCSSVCL